MNSLCFYTEELRFSTKLQYRNVELWTAADVVQFSCVAQTSILHLDLELCQSYQINSTPWIGSDYPSLTYSKCFISSEEKCRKILSKSRHLLYSLHLDLPKGRDWGLKNSSQPQNLSNYSGIPHVSKISIEVGFYFNILYNIIDYACGNSHHNIKILKWFLKICVSENFNFLLMPDDILNHCIDCMHPGISDTDFVEECFLRLDFMHWVDASMKPERVENLLHQVQRIWLKRDKFWFSEFVNRCLLHYSFAYVNIVLKFVCEPILCGTFIAERIDSIRYSKPSPKLIAYLNRINRKRSSLLIHLYWTYLTGSRQFAAACESLRMIWNSVPDVFLNYEEIESAFKEEGFGPEELEDIWKFYCDAIGECYPMAKPRSLKHLCRTTIRRRLHTNCQLLPDGIRQTDLPPRLQSYLNLEM